MDAVVTIGSNQQQLIAENLRANKTIDDQAEKIFKLSKAGKEQAKNEREGIALTKQHATAMDAYSAGVAKADRLLAAGTITTTTHRREVTRLKDELNKSTNAAGNFLAMIAKMGGAAAALKAVGGAVAEEIDLQRERERRAADESVGYGEVLRRTTANFSPDKTLGLEELDPAYAAIQERQGVKDRKSVARVAGNAFSARGQLSNAEALKFVESAFEYSGGDEEIANVMAARSLDIAKQTGQRDPRAILGFLSETQKAARVDDMRSLGKQGVVAMLGATAVGATPEESAELFATINSLMSDEEGANSKTAMLQLTGQLMDKAKIKKAGLSKQFEGKGVMERLAMLQGDKKLADKFMDAKGISFEVAAEPFIRKLVSGDKAAMELFAESKAVVPELGAGSAKALDTTIAAMDSNVHTRLSNIDRQATAKKQSDELDSRRREAITGEADRIFQETLEKVNLPGFDESPVWGVPGQRTIMKRNVDINRARGKGGAGSVAATMEMMSKGGAFSELGGTLSQQDTTFLMKQLVEINKLQLEEQKLDREQAKRNAAAPAPAAAAAPQVPLIAPAGGDPSLHHPGVQ